LPACRQTGNQESNKKVLEGSILLVYIRRIVMLAGAQNSPPKPPWFFEGVWIFEAKKTVFILFYFNCLIFEVLFGLITFL
jgi:hypothetical protein